MPDPQKAALYEAEFNLRRVLDSTDPHSAIEIAGSTIYVPIERHFTTLDDVRYYLTQVVTKLRLDNVSFPSWVSVPDVRERKGRDRSEAQYFRNEQTIELPLIERARLDWSMRELVILHEMAHHLCRDFPLAGHGPIFASAFLELVEHVMGHEAGFLLRVLMHQSGVQIAPLFTHES